MSSPQPKGDGYVVFFAATVCVVCSLLLSVAASSLKTRQDYNVELDRKLNVLKAFGVAIADEQGKRLAGSEVERYFTEHISEVILDGATGQPIEGLTGAAVSKDEIASHARLPLYVWRDGGETTKYAFPVFGKGLWSTIYGYLALDRDLATVIGATFYKHGETPGLGGEVEKDWFQANFRGKKVHTGEDRQNLIVVKGKVADLYPDGNDHAVDGISGATLTGKGVQRFINEDLDLYEKYFKLQRGARG